MEHTEQFERSFYSYLNVVLKKLKWNNLGTSVYNLDLSKLSNSL